MGRVETTPATRSYRYTDYWGTEVTAFESLDQGTPAELVVLGQAAWLSALRSHSTTPS